jgi:LmbE family N-acetylglucosaminyl deacetylase
MKAIAIVAHPDDCILFAMGMIVHMPKWTWSIGYLTYTRDSDRGREIGSFWKRRNIATHWLGYVDDYRDIERGAVSFDADRAAADIQSLISAYDVVVTHDAHGDYGHPHHRFVNACVAGHHPAVITFSPFGKGNLHIALPAGLYTLDEIPQHATLGDFISPVNRHNEYHVPAVLKSQYPDLNQ